MVNLDSGELLQRKKRRRRRIRTSELHTAPRLLRPATLAIAVGIVLLGGAWWHFTQDARVATAHQAEMGGSFQPHASDLAHIAKAPQAAETPPSPAPVVSKASAPAPVMFPNYVAINDSPTEPGKAQPTGTAKAEPQASGKAVKETKADAAKAKQTKDAKDAAARREKTRKDQNTVERVAEAPAPAPAPPAPAPAPRQNPEQNCQGQGFLSRAACMQSQCAQPGNANTPQCKRMFEAQEALRRGSGGG